MNIIYGVCSWGLGHATRSLPVIRALIDEGHNLTIISSGGGLALLKRELGVDKGIVYVDIEDYPIPLAENTRQFIAKTILYWPIFIKKIEDGLQQLSRILEKNKYDRVISDGRYDIYSKKIPSYFISHQMRIMNPLRIRIFEKEMERFNLFFFKRYKAFIIPDYKDDDLSGDLSHNLDLIDEDKLHYVGVLSDFKKRRIKRDIDYLISISGPEPQRTILEKLLLKEVERLEGNIVITLGKPECSELETIENHITIYTSVDKNKREELLNKARLCISRSGYSTIMDLAVVGTKALMIPTPGQTEQEYLAEYHNKKNTFYSVRQHRLSLEEDVEKARKTNGITRECKVEKTVRNILDILST
ncbi:MAG: glycosyltransferase family protein [Candidatus Thermoplasmatota archaeon]